MTSANPTPNASAPTPLDWQDLIASARDSIGSQPAAESRAANHRAVSTAYYATYDALCASNASVLVPQVTDQASIDAWGAGVSWFLPRTRHRKLEASPDLPVAGRAGFRSSIGGSVPGKAQRRLQPQERIHPARRRASPGPGGSGHRQVRTTAAVGTGGHRNYHPCLRDR